MVKAIKILGLLLVCLSVYGTTVNSIRVRVTYDGTNIYDTPITVVGVDTNNSFKVTFTATNLTVLKSPDGTNWNQLLTTGYESMDPAPTNQLQKPTFPLFISQLPVPDAPVLTAK